MFGSSVGLGASLDCDRLAGCIVQLCQIGPQTAGMRERRRAATKSCKVRFSARLPCPAPSLSAPSQPTQSHQLQAGTGRGQFWKSTNNESNNNMLCWFFLTLDSACPLLRLLLQCTSAKSFLSFWHLISKVGFPHILIVSPSMATNNAENSSTVSLDVLCTSCLPFAVHFHNET